MLYTYMGFGWTPKEAFENWLEYNYQMGRLNDQTYRTLSSAYHDRWGSARR